MATGKGNATKPRDPRVRGDDVTTDHRPAQSTRRSRVRGDGVGVDQRFLAQLIGMVVGTTALRW